LYYDLIIFISRRFFVEKISINCYNIFANNTFRSLKEVDIFLNNKMLRYAALIFFIFALSCPPLLAANPANNFPDGKERETIIKNRVKSITEFEYSYGPEKKENPGVKKTTLKYDGSGNLSESVSYDEAGNISLRSVNIFAQNSRKKRQIDIRADKSVESSAVYKYDQGGRLIEESWFYGDSLDKKFVHRYDARGLETEFFCALFDGTIDFRYAYKYDARGNKTFESYHEKNMLSYKHAFKYNDAGLLTEKISYGPDDETIAVENYKYDADKNKTLETRHDLRSNTNMKTAYKYDAGKNLVETSEYAGSRLARRFEYAYNKNGGIVEETNFNEDQTIEYRLRYRYDDSQNLIEEIKYNSKDGIIYKMTCKYDGLKNIVEKVKYKYQSFSEPESAVRYFYEFYK